MWFLLQQCWPSLAALVGQQALLSGQKQIAIKYCTKLWKTDLVLKGKTTTKKTHLSSQCGLPVHPLGTLCQPDGLHHCSSGSSQQPGKGIWRPSSVLEVA